MICSLGDSEALTALGVAVSFLILAAATHLLHVRYKLDVEITRKVFHTGGGILALFFPYLFQNLFWPAILCGACAAALIVSKARGQFSALNATERNTWGAPLFPLAVIGTFFLSRLFSTNEEALYNSALGTLTFADSAAALAGNFPRKNASTKKTLRGSVAFFICAVIVNFSALLLFSDYQSITYFMGLSIFAGVASTLVEAVSNRGLDNITIPMAVAAAHLLAMNF